MTAVIWCFLLVGVGLLCWSAWLDFQDSRERDLR